MWNGSWGWLCWALLSVGLLFWLVVIAGGIWLSRSTGARFNRTGTR
jgi:hypothetical protein